MPNRNKRGMILLIVVLIIMVVALLSTAILRIISSQSRLTHHQVSRIQAQYAARAGSLYALDKLRRNDTSWYDSVSPVVKNMCRQTDASDPCLAGDLCCRTPDIIESDLPNSVRGVKITVGIPNSGVANTRKVSATATYTYTP